jgi:hypothetical protein
VGIGGEDCAENENSGIYFGDKNAVVTSYTPCYASGRPIYFFPLPGGVLYNLSVVKLCYVLYNCFVLCYITAVG